ncbi:MAG: phenazine biosynthesis protein [Rhodobacteraceae bacterium CG2_30_10_405]|nr:MAG: phenazine biosynthesis protein [Rhodobacteraceae bacterium CG2_30_10_405]
MLEFHTLDVFTTQPFAGNPLAVVLGAGGLTPGQMQAMAREFALSETIFVAPADDPAHAARVRIFTPASELPFAGHPTIGCAVLLAGTAQGAGDFDATLVLEEAAGMVPVTVSRRGDVTEAEFTAPVIPHAAPGAAPPALVARALDLAPDDLGFGHHRIALWQGGVGYLYVPVASLDALARAWPLEPHWSDLMDRAGVDSAYLYTPGVGVDFQARLFGFGSGIFEDPATGSAAAILAAQLRASRALPPGPQVFALAQGVEMGRPSTMWLTVEHGPDGIEAVRIKGAAVPVASGRIAVPQGRAE